MHVVRAPGTRNGGSRRWRRIRAYVLERDGYTCQLRLDGCTHKAEHAHHVLGWEYGDAPEDASGRRLVVASCAHCNLKTGRPNLDPSPTPRTRWT